MVGGGINVCALFSLGFPVVFLPLSVVACAVPLPSLFPFPPFSSFSFHLFFLPCTTTRFVFSVLPTSPPRPAAAPVAVAVSAAVAAVPPSAVGPAPVVASASVRRRRRRPRRRPRPRPRRQRRCGRVLGARRRRPRRPARRRRRRCGRAAAAAPAVRGVRAPRRQHRRQCDRDRRPSLCLLLLLPWRRPHPRVAASHHPRWCRCRWCWWRRWGRRACLDIARERRQRDGTRLHPVQRPVCVCVCVEGVCVCEGIGANARVAPRTQVPS